MLDYSLQGASALLKRSGEGTQPPGNWMSPIFGVIFTLEFFLFLPVFIFLTYTLSTLYPALAIVEDDHAPPTYQPLALDADADEEGGQRTPTSEFPVTASLRRVHTLVKSIDGWRSLFRGIVPLLVTNFATSTLRVVFSAPSPVYLGPLAAIPAHLALVQLHTVWLHVVITPPSATPFWKRLTPFGRAFRATVRPIVLYAVAKEIARGVPLLVFMWLAGDSMTVGSGRSFNPLLVFAVAPLAFVLWFFVELPAQIALMRIQASLLPPDEDPIVPFDRSFGGRVNPLFMVGGVEGETGKTYATLRDIWETISKEGMWRVARLVIKVTGVHVVVWLVAGSVFGATAALAGIPITGGSY